MKSMRKQHDMARREKASEKARIARKKSNPVNYRVENGDIIILSGPYTGQTVRSLWLLGPIERDYVVKHIWFSGNPEITAILNSLSCK